MPQVKENIAEVLQADSGQHPLPKKCRRKRQQGKPGRDSEEELLEAAMTPARETEDGFFQAVPQDVTMN